MNQELGREIVRRIKEHPEHWKKLSNSLSPMAWCPDMWWVNA